MEDEGTNFFISCLYISSMAVKNAQPVPLRFIPFSDASPAMLNYYMYIVALIAFALSVYARKATWKTFAIHAVVAFAIMMVFNFFLHCMMFGNCLRGAMAIVTLLQVAHVAWFINDTRMGGSHAQHA